GPRPEYLRIMGITTITVTMASTATSTLTIRVGTAATDMSIACMREARGRPAGDTARRQDGEIAACRPDKPRNTAARLTNTRVVNITITRMTQGVSWCGVRSSKFREASTCTEAVAELNGFWPTCDAGGHCFLLAIRKPT